MTASDSLASLLAEYRRDRTLADSSFQQLAISANKFCVWHAETLGRPPTIADLTRPNIHDWMDALARPPRPLAAATINRKRGAVLAIANFAADFELIPPPRRIKKLTEGEDPPKAWTLEEFDRILWSARLEAGDWGGVYAGQGWDFGIRMIWDTGARFHELWAARLSAVDLDQATWTVPAKDRKGKRKGRVYTLAADTIEAIAATIDPAAPRERLWPFPWHKRQVWPHWDRILIRAGLPTGRKAKWHCVRKTAESHAAAAMGPRWASEAIGHSEAVARRHYLDPMIVKPPALVVALPRPDPKPRLGLFVG